MSHLKSVRVSLLSLVAAFGIASSASAISFDVLTLVDNDAPSPSDGVNMSATGTSGGIGWKIDVFNTWLANTNIGNNYTGFSGPNFTPALALSDRLHTFGTDMTIVFDEKVSSILFYIEENAGNSTLDFGLIPTLVSGFATINGTAVTADIRGGVVRFSGLNTDTLSSVTTIRDGMDVAWVVESVVDSQGVPDAGSSALLLGTGLIGLFVYRRRMA